MHDPYGYPLRMDTTAIHGYSPLIGGPLGSLRFIYILDPQKYPGKLSLPLSLGGYRPYIKSL